MDYIEALQIEDELFAQRTALMLLASAMEDRFEPGVLRERLEFLAEEASMRGAKAKFEKTAEILNTMAKNLHTEFSK